jgi:hypothetical protein
MPAISFAGNPSSPPDFLTQLSSTFPNWSKSDRLLLFVKGYGGDGISASAFTPPDPSTIDTSTPEGIAAENGYETEWYGKVMSVAPGVMTILNTDPALFDMPIGGLTRTNPMEFLLKSLSQQQFDQFTTTGLGMSDLTEDQQALFAEIIPDPLSLVPSDADPNIDTYRSEIVKLPRSQILDQARLHAYLKQSFGAGGYANSCSFSDNFSDYILNGSRGFTAQHYSTGPMKIAIDNDVPSAALNQESNTKELAADLVSVQPNILKQGDIKYTSRQLAHSVSVDGITTVDELVARISQVVGLELYADARYGSSKIYFGGDTKSTYRAGDIMRAISLSACGTWRKVGPAYVLTDDVDGLGTRDAFLEQVISSWSNRLKSYGGDIPTKLAKLHWFEKLSNSPGDPNVLSKDQLSSVLNGGAKNQATISWSELPPGIQTQFAKQIDEQNEKAEETKDQPPLPNRIVHITPTTPVDIEISIETAIELPGDGIMSLSPIVGNFSPSEKPVSTTAIVMPEKVRAVICAPTTPEEARKTVDSLPSLGFNTLIIDVFCNGRTYFKSSTIPPAGEKQADVLEAAIAESLKKHIAVYAAADLFCWRKDYSEKHLQPWLSNIAEDLDIFTEPSEVSGMRQLENDSYNATFLPNKEADFIKINEANDGWVSPLDPAVQKLIPSLVAEIAKTPGLSGMVFQDTTPPGSYRGSNPFSLSLDMRLGLGCNMDNRLFLLRNNHMDPVDDGGNDMLSIYSDPSVDFDINPFINIYVPGFPKAKPEINKYLSVGVKAAMAECFNAAKTANPSLPLFLREETYGLTITPWEAPEQVHDSPNILYDGEDTVNNDPKAVIFTIPLLDITTEGGASLPDAVNGFRETYDKGNAGGIAFDLVEGGVNQDVPKMLDWLKIYIAAK